MATALTVAKARAVGLGIEKMIGVTPSYRYYPD